MFKALIVDDELQIRKGLRTIIPWDEAGFVIVGEAADGAEAMDLIRQHPPNLVITDVKMPHMGGIELSKQIRQLYPDTVVLILSGYNQFSYAKEAMKYGVSDYILKPVDPDELSSILEQIYDKLWQNVQNNLKEKEIVKTLRNAFFGKLIRGEVSKEVVQSADGLNIDLQHTHKCCVFIVTIDRYDDFLSLSGEEIELKRFAMGNVMEELLIGCGYLFELSEREFGILFIEQEELKGWNLREFAENMVDNIERYVKETVSIGIGSIVNNIDKISESYNCALKVLERKFFFDKEHVFVFQQEDEMNQTNINWIDSGLLHAIREGNRDWTAKEIDELFAPLEVKASPLDNLKYCLMTTIIHLGKMTEDYHGDWQNFYRGEFSEVESIMTKGSLSSLKRFLKRISLEICTYIENENSRQPDNRILEAIEYVETNYTKELNLKKLSKQVHYNPVYLGQLFKKETGAYFKDYIIQVRIKHASTLLEQTELSMLDIAERVGYKYVDHFYRHFKQLHGITPGKFRSRVVD